ncbi:MAG TPA: GGDEF domain-containing protein [Mycobacteriales bacterium]|nr:GGDEF domain-containing protein [Mycobacteriales bacterium]
MLNVARKMLPLLLSVALVVGLGVVAAWGHLTNAKHVDAAKRADRVRMEQTLSGLTSQYLQFVFLDTQRAGATVRWSLRPGDPADRAGLRRIAETSHLATYGATLTSTTGRPLNGWAREELPSPTDPGFTPLRAALAAGKPGLSSVLRAGDRALVAFAVPVVQDGAVVALLTSYADAREWPLQEYDTTIHLGADSATYVLDPERVVAASSKTSAVGTRLRGLPAVVTSGATGILDARRGGAEQVVSYASAGHGWTTVTLQGTQAFSGGAQSRNQRDALFLIVLLTVVVLLLAGLNHSRQQALRRLADERLHDPLTGLAQRRLFAYRFDAALARQRRTRQPLAVLYCDLDGFKGVNDAFGHNVGDQLLAAVAARLRSVTREDDFVARLGGDEFAVVLEGTDVAEVQEVVTRLRSCVQQPLTLGAHTLEPRISVGAAVLRDPARADDLLREADMAMYRVKSGSVPEALVVLSSLTSSTSEPFLPRASGEISARR